MPWYRLYFWDVLEEDAGAVEATSVEEATALFADQAGGELEEGCSVIELPKEIESVCTCSSDDEIRTFINLAHPAYPGSWECQNCKTVYTQPPDEINWGDEQMLQQGYIQCPRCTSYNDSCRLCCGSGWWDPSGEPGVEYDHEDKNWYADTYEDQPEGPYYEDGQGYELNLEDDDVGS